MRNKQDTQAATCAEVRSVNGFHRLTQTNYSSNAYLKGIAAIVATVLAAFAISYLAHLDKTGAYTVGGLLSTLSAITNACSLQDALIAVPFGALIWLRTPPPRLKTRS